MESNIVFGLLFLYNNLHVAHHFPKPTMPWYEIPRAFTGSNRAGDAVGGQRAVRLPPELFAFLPRRYLLLAPVFSPVSSLQE